MSTLRNWTTAIVLVLFVASTGPAGEIPRAKPEDVGMSSAKLAKVNEAIQKMVDDKIIAGAITMVARKGKIVHFEARGMRDIESEQPVEKDTIVRFYSMTKPITTVAAMILFEEGKYKLDDPLEKYLPELKDLKVYNNGDQPAEQERKVTIRDLMRHTSGLTYGAGKHPVDKMYKEAKILESKNLRRMIEKLSKIPLRHQPGTKFHYGVSTDVLGALVQRVSGVQLDAFFQKRIFDPLDMKDTGFFVSEKSVKRFSSCYGPGLKTKDKFDTSKYLKKPSLLSGGGGLVSTARDYMRFCQMLINKGQLQGRRILKPQSVEMMTRNQMPGGGGMGRSKVLGFGLGFRVWLEDRGAHGRVGEYGWGGAASTFFWISPKDDLAVVALTQYMPFKTRVRQTVKRLVYQAIEKN